MIKTLLRVGLFFFSLICLPVFIVVSLFNKRLRTTLLQRLCLGHWKELKKTKEKLIWIHAASLGEINGVGPIVEKIKMELPQVQILCTCISDTGRVALKKINDTTLIFPYDNAFFARKALEKAKPDLILIAETEIWPSFMLELKDIPVVYFNARVSDYTFSKYKLFSSLLKKVFKPVRKLFAQTELDAKRFIELGVDNVEVAGNTKSDSLQVKDFDKSELLKKYKIEKDDKVIVAGSVHPKEDLQVIKAYKELLKNYKNLKLIIAPRHDFEHTAQVLNEEGLTFSKRSENEISEKVILLDQMGELSKVYSLATTAFVGGSLVDVGGHNPLEPARFSVPVVMGQYYSTVRDSVKALEGALKIVNNQKELEDTLKFYLENGNDAGIKAREVFEKSRGASQTVIKEVAKALG